MDQPRQSGVQVVGLHGQVLQCQSIHATHLGLNSRYILTVEGNNNVPLNDQDFGKVTLHITCDNQSYFYHGELLSLQQDIKRSGLIGFQLTIGSTLTRLDNDTNQRQFIDQTPVEIIQTFLDEHDIQAIFNLENLDYKLAYTAQGGTSDYDFLLQFCITHGIVFYYRHDKHAATLHFSNKNYHAQQHRFNFNPGNGLVESESVITSLNYWQVKLLDNIHLTGANEDDPDTIFQQQTTNTTSIPGQGLLKLSRPFIINNEKDCLRHARCLQQQLDWQREWVKIDLRDQVLQAGDTLQISHHPSSKLNRLFRVIETNFSQNVSNSTKAHQLHTTAYLIPAEAIYRMPEKYTRMHWPYDQEPPHCLAQSIQHPPPALMLSEISGVLDKPRIGDMVLFDTVVALGLPGTPVKMGFKLGIPPSVENVLHITANDEHRLFFPLHSVIDDKNDSRIIEIGLPGAHADIGGGYNNGYSKIALHLAYTYMKKLGLPLKSISNYLLPSVDDPDLRLHDSRYLTDKLWQNSKKVIGFQDHRQIYHIHNQ